MRFRKILQTRLDWLIVTTVLAISLALTLVLVLYIRNLRQAGSVTATPLRSYDLETYNQGIYYSPPPDPKYPPHAKDQLMFYRTYQKKEISYSLEKTEYNVNRDPAVGRHTFTVELYNSANRTITPLGDDLSAITINCITKESPYGATPVDIKPLTFSAYERKRIALPIDVSCMYLGTADNKYYWRIY